VATLADLHRVRARCCLLTGPSRFPVHPARHHGRADGCWQILCFCRSHRVPALRGTCSRTLKARPKISVSAFRRRSIAASSASEGYAAKCCPGVGAAQFVLGCFAILLRIISGALARSAARLLFLFPTSDSASSKNACRASARQAAGGNRKIVSQSLQHPPVVPARKLLTITSTIACVFRSTSPSWLPRDNTSGRDSELLISRRQGHLRPWNSKRLIREKTERRFPGTLFYVPPRPPTIVSQAHFVLAAPVDIQSRTRTSARLCVGSAHMQPSKDPGGVDSRLPSFWTSRRSRSTLIVSRSARMGNRPAATSATHADGACGSALVARLLSQPG